MQFAKVCASCSICPRSKFELPNLAFGNPDSDILVIYEDSLPDHDIHSELDIVPFLPVESQAAMNAALSVSKSNLEEDLQIFGHIDECLFTTSVRCATLENLDEAYESCSVYTRSLIDDRKIIVTTLKGLAQFSNTLTEKAEEWKVYTTIKGYIFVIPPLGTMSKSDMAKVETEVERLKNEVNHVDHS